MQWKSRMVALLLVLAQHSVKVCSHKLMSSEEKLMRDLAALWRVEEWEGEDICSWSGVTCKEIEVKGLAGTSQQQAIQSIRVSGVCQHFDDESTCVLPSYITKFRAIEHLYLAGNGFYGSIPADIGSVSSLKSLFLNSNNLVGAIPSSIGKLKNLEKLHLNSNKLSGSIPREIGGATSLHQLELQQNELTGSIPDTIGELKSLVQLDLNENELEGEIPPALGALKELHRLFLADNLLHGDIPAELLGPHMVHLKKVDLSNNKLKGFVPLGVCKLGDLILLRLSGNAELEGNVPECDAPYGPYADEENKKHCKSQIKDMCRGLSRHDEF